MLWVRPIVLNNGRYVIENAVGFANPASTSPAMPWGPSRGAHRNRD
ncbi:hypothetical protein [Mycolicibacterium tusciae]|nr:hypothetical protein [Mycolicibacterium tusciae]